MSKWYKASELERLKTLTARDGVNGLPDNHVITVSERTIRIDERELVQNNVSTDTYTLELDAEWDDITPVVIFSNSEGDYKVAYENAPTKIPAAVMAVVGAVDVSVFGLDSTGAVRVVTKAAPNTMNVVESGKFVGEISEDDVSLLGQILAAVEAANQAAENANATIIKSAVATTLNPGDPATANLADHVLTIGVPKGEKGDKGDPGQDGVTPFTQATVTTLDPGTPATVTIAEDTLKLGIPKGDKGDQGDQGDKGETGDKGDPGTAATIEVGSVTGLDAGASPTVVNSGTSTAARFDFGIPKGDKGDTGDPGHTPQRGVDYWTAEDVEAVVEDAKAQAVAELAEIGNVPKGTVSGYVAHAKDAYAQKPIEVRVKGRTVKNLWPVINTTEKGVTVATDDTGIITLSGQNTASDNSFPYVSVEGVVAGKQYTLTTSVIGGMTIETFYIYAQAHGADGGYLQSFTLATINQQTITLPEGTKSLRCGFIIRSGQSASWSGRIMLVEGSEAPDCFTPPASITSVQTGNLVTAGKNLISFGPDTPKKTSNENINDGDILVGVATSGYIDPLQITELDVNDGSVNATSIGYGYGVGFVRYLPKGTAFTVSGEVTDNVRVTFTYVSDDKIVVNRLSYGESDLATTGKVPGDCIGVAVIVRDKGGKPPSNFTVIPQLELGSTATAYEPPNITTTPLPEVELRSLPNGTCDELVIKADGTCNVERRTQLSGEEVTALPEPTTESQSPVTLPKLPAPTFNAYHDSDVPSDTSATYTRDINIALADLEAQIADLVTKEAANV